MSHAIETLQDSLENLTIAQPSLSVAARRDRERAMALSLCNHHHLNQPLFNAYNISQSIAKMSLTSTRPPAKPTPVVFIFHAVDKHRGSTFDYDAVVWRLKPGIKKGPTQFCCNIGQLFAHAVCGYMFAATYKSAGREIKARVVYATCAGCFKDGMVVEGDEGVFEGLMEMVERGRERHVKADGECVVEFRVFELEIDVVVEDVLEG